RNLCQPLLEHGPVAFRGVPVDGGLDEAERQGLHGISAARCGVRPSSLKENRSSWRFNGGVQNSMAAALWSRILAVPADPAKLFAPRRDASTVACSSASGKSPRCEQGPFSAGKQTAGRAYAGMRLRALQSIVATGSA